MKAQVADRIGIYVRESRDDYGEKHETIETQRELLVDYACRHGLGQVCSIYEDDNVSGSGFERAGIERLREDVLTGRIDLLLVKDLSRLGRNNAKTLQFLDFLEEYGVRVLSSDGRYDSRLGDDLVGIETWANERYVRDISRKIRSSLRFKIQRGEYVGHAPFGYRKLEGKGNRLFIDDFQAETVRSIYRLYLSGLGYAAIAARLNEDGHPSPGGGSWNKIAVRRILVSSVYIGDTVQGVSERVSFKSKKTRRLPREAWVVTEDTHEAIVPEEVFQEVQKKREGRGNGGRSGGTPHKEVIHVFRGLIRCGDCGSALYARKAAGGIAYVCGNYCRYGKKACTSHFIYEDEIATIVCEELVGLFASEDCLKELERWVAAAGRGFAGGAWDCRGIGAAGPEWARRRLSACRRQQDMLYADRLEGRISAQHFDRMNSVLEERLRILEAQLRDAEAAASAGADIGRVLGEAVEEFRQGRLTNEIAAAIVDGITVFHEGNSISGEVGTVVIDFRMK
jgi:DNA invertase Pin-like site-specific DNA recombinase